MNVFYSQIESEIVDHLEVITNGGAVDVVQLPQIQEEYQRPFNIGRVTVAYKSSDFGEPGSPYEISQEERIHIEVVIQARSLRGNTGLHAITEAVKRRLIGFRPTDCTKMYLVKNGFTENNPDTATWAYSMVFESRYLLVEDKEYNTENPVEDIIFEYNEEVPSIPPIPFPGTYPNPPVIAYKGDVAYWDGEVWRRLNPGEPGHVLATMGQGQVPEWVSPQSGPAGQDGDRYYTTSTTQLTVGNGAKTLTVEAGLAYIPQQTVIIVNDGVAHMHATIEAYDHTTGVMAVDVEKHTGSGTYSTWEVNLSGAIGVDGKSAYDIAVENGFVGTESEWLASLIGADGQDGQDGQDGASAYEVAVANGFTGTEAQWLASLEGPQGPAGPVVPLDGLSDVDQAATKATPIDADSVLLLDSTDSIWKRLTWARIKARLSSVFQAVLVSGTNIKTVNGSSLLGSGDFLTIPQLTTAQRDAIAAPVAGYPIYNTTEGYLETYDSFWGWMPVSGQNEWLRKWGFEYWNDNVNNDAVLAQVTNGTGNSFNTANSAIANNRPGNCIFFLGTSAGASLRVLCTSPYILGGGRIYFDAAILAQILSNSTNRFVFLVGFFGQAGQQLTAANQNNGCYFLYDEGGVSSGSAASPNWQCVTAAGGVRTFTTTTVPWSVPPNPNSYKLWVVVNDAANEVKFYINETLVATHTTNVPVGFSQPVAWGIGGLRIAGSSSFNVAFADYIGYKQKFTTPR